MWSPDYAPPLSLTVSLSLCLCLLEYSLFSAHKYPCPSGGGCPVRQNSFPLYSTLNMKLLLGDSRSGRNLCPHLTAQLCAPCMCWQNTSNMSSEAKRELAFCTGASKQGPIQSDLRQSPKRTSWSSLHVDSLLVSCLSLPLLLFLFSPLSLQNPTVNVPSWRRS